MLMVRNHMAETLKAATTFIEQGRILLLAINFEVEVCKLQCEWIS